MLQEVWAFLDILAHRLGPRAKLRLEKNAHFYLQEGIFGPISGKVRGWPEEEKRCRVCQIR